MSARWEDGRYGAVEVAAQALGAGGVEAAWLPGAAWLELPLPALWARASEVARREGRVGGRAYIGSTSDPAWRWQGGRYLPSENGRHAVEGWAWMDGHRLQWRRMAILGAWRDADTGTAEKETIQYIKISAPGVLTNIATDARGLSRRPYAYSFVYICFDQIVPTTARNNKSHHHHHHPSLITNYPLAITHYPLPITHYPLPIIHYPSPVTSSSPC